LAYEANVLSNPNLLLNQVITEDFGFSAGGLHKCREHLLGCGFASAVRTQKTKDFTLLHSQVYAFYSFNLLLLAVLLGSEGFLERFGFYYVFAGHSGLDITKGYIGYVCFRRNSAPENGASCLLS
jgi:hypothetical protein